MKKLLMLMLLSSSLMTDAQTTRVLLVGDSWAQQQFEDNVHAVVFANHGIANIMVDGTTTARSGSLASEWATATELQIIANAIAANPNIDTVQLTIGGNDFLNSWTANMSTQQEQALKQQIVANLTTVVNFILDQDANIEIILSFYDYPNFVDTISGLSGFDCNNLLTAVGTPSTAMLNTAVTNFELAYAQIAAANPRVYHVSHLGLMQNFYNGTALPGNISSPSPVAAMREIFPEVFDCIHLSPGSYTVLVENLYAGYYENRFDTVFKSGFE